MTTRQASRKQKEEAAFRKSVETHLAQPGYILARVEREMALRCVADENHYRASQLFGAAEWGYRRTFVDVDTDNSVVHPEWGGFLNDKAACLLNSKRADAALAILHEAKAVQVSVMGDRHLGVSPTQHNLALAYLQRGVMH